MLMNLNMHLWIAHLNENKSFSLHKREQPQMLRSLFKNDFPFSIFHSHSLIHSLQCLYMRLRSYLDFNEACYCLFRVQK